MFSLGLLDNCMISGCFVVEYAKKAIRKIYENHPPVVDAGYPIDKVTKSLLKCLIHYRCDFYVSQNNT